MNDDDGDELTCAKNVHLPIEWGDGQTMEVIFGDRILF